MLFRTCKTHFTVGTLTHFIIAMNVRNHYNLNVFTVRRLVLSYCLTNISLDRATLMQARSWLSQFCSSHACFMTKGKDLLSILR